MYMNVCIMCMCTNILCSMLKLVLAYLSTYQKHKRCLISPYTAFVADHPVLSIIIKYGHSQLHVHKINILHECACHTIVHHNHFNTRIRGS